MREPTTEDLNEIREKLTVLEQEMNQYRTLLDEYELGEKELQDVLNWIDETEELHKL